MTEELWDTWDTPIHGPRHEPNFEALYYKTADRCTTLANEVGQLQTALVEEKRAHLEHCRELEGQRTIAEHRLERLERRSGTERRYYRVAGPGDIPFSGRRHTDDRRQS
jgi:hypothetical protein